MEDGLRWEMTYDGIRPSVEDNIWWKTTFSGKLPLVQDDLWCKITFSGRQPSVEEALEWKMTFPGTSMEDNLHWKTIFTGRRSLVKNSSFESHSTTEPKPELLSAVLTRDRICHHREMYAALCMHTCAEKTIFLGKDIIM